MDDQQNQPNRHDRRAAMAKHRKTRKKVIQILEEKAKKRFERSVKEAQGGVAEEYAMR